MDVEKARLHLLAQGVRVRARFYLDEATCKAVGLTAQQMRWLAAGGQPLKSWQVRMLAKIMEIDTRQVA